jgi:hypothetical protein
MYAFILVHFGKNPKYLEYELYFLYSFRNKTKNDIIYFYSINDTPIEYINIIKSLNLNIKTIPYDDNNITFNVSFKSAYTSFNLLRICNYIFAFNLIQYKKICTVESDMIISENIDDIFELKCPSIIYYPFLTSKNPKIYENVPVIINKKYKQFLIDDCPTHSFTNGGIVLFKPSLSKFNELKNNLKIIIEKNCIYPNETLFLIYYNKIYNLPIYYNYSHFFVPKENLKYPIKVLHFNNTDYKPINIIEDKDFDINKMKNKYKKKIIIDFKNNYYNKFNKKIKDMLKNI